MTPAEHIQKLEGLLARVRQRASEPRVPKVVATPEPAAEPLAVAAPEPAAEPLAVSEARELEAPTREIEAPPLSTPAVEVGDDLPIVEERRSASGEYAAVAPPAELELLGPASGDELEPIVQARHEPSHADVPDVTILTPVVEDGPAALDVLGESGPAPGGFVDLGDLLAEGRGDEPAPASGRGLVAAPHESQRIAVAAPRVPDEAPLGLPVEPLPLSDEPPTSSRRRASASPPEAVEAALGEVFRATLPPKLQEPAGPDELRAALAPADVGSWLEATRTPRPETFGQLLDAALGL